jgi:hypothetical protein
VQTSAVPDLAHTHARPVHWLATAAAMAAVVAGAGMLQPKAATASQADSQAQTSTAAAPVPDPATAQLPLECRGAKSVVTKQASGDLDGDGSPETVAVARCDAGSGTPPSGVYVLTPAEGASARVVATLVEPAQKLSVSDIAVRDGVVTATLLGYSSPDVPSCCPDRQEKVKWQWQGGKFVRSAQVDARSV